MRSYRTILRTFEIMNKYVAYNPKQICYMQLKSSRNLLRTTEILKTSAAHNWNRKQICSVQLLEILDKTSQDAAHPRKSRTKLHKMRPIPGNPGQNLTRCAPSPEIPENPGKKLTKRRFACWLVGCWLLVGWFRQAMQRPPEGAIKSHWDVTNYVALSQQDYFERYGDATPKDML